MQGTLGVLVDDNIITTVIDMNICYIIELCKMLPCMCITCFKTTLINIKYID